jgi:glutathione S-transferase
MKLYRFHYSPYARKVQVLLELMGRRFEPVEVAYSDRRELATLTGGYIHVPVLVAEGKPIFDSRKICEWLTAQTDGVGFVPAPFEGPIWAYHDWCDGGLEDVLFRLASPVVRESWENPGERALYTVMKERKFGTGCVDAWAAATEELLAKGKALLAPTGRTLAVRPFLFGDRPTLADAALYGQLAMTAVEPGLVARLGEVFPAFMKRVEAARVVLV